MLIDFIDDAEAVHVIALAHPRREVLAATNGLSRARPRPVTARNRRVPGCPRSPISATTVDGVGARRALFGLACAHFACATGFPASDTPKHDLLGAMAPVLEAPTLDGHLLSLPGSGRPMVIDFWATWCAPCVAQMPELVRLHQRHAGRVAFVGVSGDDNPVTALKALAKLGVTYPNVLDGADRRFQGAYLVTDLPHTFVLDRHGRVRLVLRGERPDTLSRLERALAALLEEP